MVAHSNIVLDRLLLWLRSAFAVALFRQPHAMSQHLFPSRVAFIFGCYFVLMARKSNHSFNLFQHIPKTYNGVKVRTVWSSSCSPDTHVSSCSTLSQLEPDESWHCRPGICLSHQGRKKSIDEITWSFSTFRNSELWTLTWPTEATPDHNTTICWFKSKWQPLFWPGSVYGIWISPVHYTMT